MAFTGYIKTDTNPSKLFPKGHTFIITSINKSSEISSNFFIDFMISTYHKSAISDQRYNFLDIGATEPVADAKLDSTAFGGTITTYSATCPGYVKSWTSDAGIFTSNQNFDDHNTQWSITFNSYYSGTLASGNIAYMRFEFYKRDSSNNDTLLFSTSNYSIGTINNEQTKYIIPTGSVTTSDRLRIRCYIYEAPPM